VRDRLSEHPEIDAEEALVSVVALLKRKLNTTELDHMLDELPNQVRARIETTGQARH